MTRNPEIENEVKPEHPKKSGFTAIASLLDFFEIVVISIIAVLLLFTFCVRLCRVDGGSMKNTLQDGEKLITTNLFFEPKQGDIVVFHLVNDHYRKPLVKRVIATEGQEILIRLDDKEVFVDGVLLEESYIYLDTGIYNPDYFDRSRLSTDAEGHTVFCDIVPEGMLFVMGDNRNHSADSRSMGVSMVDENCVIGKAILRLSPFSIFD